MRALWALGCWLAVASIGISEPGGSRIELVDDRGEPILGPLDVCVVVGLERTCRVAEGPITGLPDEGFDTLTVEGPGHGPTTTRRREISPGEGGAARLVLPRKARLRVLRLPTEPVTLSLYRADDPVFRYPVLRLTSVGSAPVLIPAGDFVLSLSARGLAPDLHLLTVAPGGGQAVEHRSRAGWSLVLRVVASERREPLGGAAVILEALPGYGGAATGPVTAKIGSAGLAVVTGVTARIAAATVRHPGYVEGRAPGISASPGTFAFREVVVERGGSVRAEIRLEGRAAAGASCKLRVWAPPAERGGGDPWRVVEERTADGDGVCRFSGLARGSYSLLVRPASEPTAHDEPLAVEPGRETVFEIDLHRIAIAGTVSHGDDPAAGYQVAASRLGTTEHAERVATATTDEEGGYRLVVWTPGDYVVTVKSPSGTLAATEREDVGPGGATLDVRLAAGEIRGLVTDEKGEPVPGASVGFASRWEHRRVTVVPVDDAGAFALPIEAGDGKVELTAMKEGYHSSETVMLEIEDGALPPPVVLVLKRSSQLEGIVVTAAGAPVASARVAAYETGADGMPWRIGVAATDARGHFSVPRSRSGPARLFVTGPGCPLTALDVASPDGSAVVACATAPAHLEVVLKDADGQPVGQETLALRRGEIVVPRDVVASHLATFGLPLTTDGAGRLVLPGLEPGSYDLYLGSASSPMTIAAGLPHGHLGSVALSPLATSEIEVVVAPTATP